MIDFSTVLFTNTRSLTIGQAGFFFFQSLSENALVIG